MFDLDGYPYHMEKTEYTDVDGAPIYIVVDLENGVVYAVSVHDDEIELADGHIAEAPWEPVERLPEEVLRNMHLVAQEYSDDGHPFRVDPDFAFVA